MSTGGLVDSHVHVWAPREGETEFPFGEGLVPPIDGHCERLLEDMDRAGVKAALIVQPKNHGFDHSYMTSVIRRHPSRFKGMLLADPRDPSDGGRGVEQMEELVRNEGYCGVRFHPYIWPAGERMTNAVGKALYKKAGELGVPVGHMVMKGLLQHIDEIEELIAFSPETTVVLDHFAFCPMDEPDHAAWDRLVALARHPNVYIKLSAFFRVTSAKHPYPAAPAKIRQLVDAFGAQRLMWGTDWPWVTEECDYAKAWSLLTGQDESGKPILSEEERRWIASDTAAKVFNAPEWALETGTVSGP